MHLANAVMFLQCGEIFYTICIYFCIYKGHFPDVTLTSSEDPGNVLCSDVASNVALCAQFSNHSSGHMELFINGRIRGEPERSQRGANPAAS